MITDAAHSAGGRIYCQLWHCGRVALPDMRDGEMLVAPSPIPATDADSKADLVAYGVPYIANLDLFTRFVADAPLNKPDPQTFYGAGSKGYADDPAIDEAS